MSLFDSVDRSSNYGGNKFSPRLWRPSIGEPVIVTESTGYGHTTYKLVITSQEHLTKLEHNPRIIKIESRTSFLTMNRLENFI